jgi:hypothetical protein
MVAQLFLIYVLACRRTRAFERSLPLLNTQVGEHEVDERQIFPTLALVIKKSWQDKDSHRKEAR